MSDERRLLKLGETYRYPRPEHPDLAAIGGFPNFYWHTATEGMPMAKLERGISRLPETRDGSGGTRIPGILIRSSPWKAGSPQTPWRDSFDADTGTVIYFGDNKIDAETGQPKHPDPSQVLGNRALLDAQFAHAANDAGSRSASAPILMFTGVPFNGRQKGQVRFDGLGIVTGAAVVRQEDETTGLPYPNLRFEIRLLDLSADEDAIDWAWISNRRLPGRVDDALAPVSWARWCRDGSGILDNVRLRHWRVEPLRGW